MASYKKGNRGKGGTTFGLCMLLVGFILGVYLSPKIIDALPPKILSSFGIKKSEPVSRNEITGKKISEEKNEVEKNVYSLEIAVFGDPESALGLLDTLNTRGYFPYIGTAKSASGILYTIRLGSWTSKEEAINFGKNFEAKEEMKAQVVQIK